ncbi:ferredoxin [Streptomyces sp. NBC_00859]|uniref:ferredoxin n=1 Tax=Streptomyces sp. NBC_00859 TaxID=2903682 RepID=UPI00386861E8|nr:ferredoxin [Streptomyces sp. NBC_00859]
MVLNVEADTKVCVGAGQCVLVAPDVFDQRVEDGIVRVIQTDPPSEQHRAVEEAVHLCPSGAITFR